MTASATRKTKSQLEVYARQLLNKYGLHDWTVQVAEYDLRPTNEPCLGFCSHYIKNIVVKKHRDFRQTLLHEIAHALTPEDNHHGELWQKMADEIGVSFSRILPYSLEKKNRRLGRAA